MELNCRPKSKEIVMEPGFINKKAGFYKIKNLAILYKNFYYGLLKMWLDKS